MQNNQIIKSKNDKRIYKYLKLQNEIKVVLIEDQSAGKSACSVSINIGSIQDYKQVQGIAHFLEHMMYLGSQNYPDQSEFSEFLANHGSEEDNAYTSDDRTVYYYDISHQYLEQSVKRFASLFQSPLLSESGVEHEKNAVESEYVQSLQSDSFRKDSLKKYLSDKNHSYSQFSMGSLKSFSDPNLHKLVQQFHQQFYSSNLMNVVIVSKLKIEEQIKIVEHFQNIRNLQLEKPKHTIPYSKNELGKLIKINPIKKKDQLHLYWILPFQQGNYKSQPALILEHLFGQENKNSLYSLLQDCQLITSLTAGSIHQINSFTEFYLDIELTQKGLENTERVIEGVFSYLSLLREGVNEECLAECKRIRDIVFENSEKQHPIEMVTFVSEQLIDYPVSDILIGNSVISNVDVQLMNQLVQQLTLDNLNIMMMSQSFSIDELPLYYSDYKVHYSISALPPSIHHLFSFPSFSISPNKSISLPLTNPLIPLHFNKSFPSITSIQQIFSSSFSTVWFKHDHLFDSNKASIQLYLYFDHKTVYQNLNTNLYFQIYNMIFKEYINEYLYDAKILDYSFNFNHYINSFRFSLYGFTYNLHQILYYLLNSFLSLSSLNSDYLHDKFIVYQQQLYIDIQNQLFAKPFQISNLYLKQVLLKFSQFDIHQQIAAVQTLDFKSFTQNIKNLFLSLSLDWLIIGNYEKTELEKIIKEVDQLLEQKNKKKLKRENIDKQENIKLNGHNLIEKHLIKENNDKNSCYHIIYECKQKNEYQQRVMMKLVEQVIGQTFFDELRTEQQLGYNVFAYYNRIENSDYFSFVIQSNVQHSNYLQQKVEEFIIEQEQEIKSLSKQEFKEMKDGLKDIIQQDFNNLQEEVDHYIPEIFHQTFLFNRIQLELQFLSSITQKQLLEFYKSNFLLNMDKLEIHIVSSSHLEQYQDTKEARLKEGIKLITDIDQYKKNQ